MGTNQGIKYFAKLLWVLGAFACILIIATGCSKLKDNKSPDGAESPEETKYKNYDLNELRSLDFSCSHMSRTECFDFSIREQEGKISFSAWFHTEEGEEINLEDIPVDTQYMDEIKGIVGDYSLNNVKIEPESKKTKKTKDDSIIVHDATTYNFDLYWKDGTVSKMGYPGSAREEIETFLKNLAKTYEKKEDGFGK